MQAAGRALRRIFDGLYLGGGIVAAVFMIAILAIIVMQMLARWTGHVFPGATDYAGYCMAGASFFAFAYALNHGAHIRVSLVLNALGPRRRYMEIWGFAVGTVASAYFAWFAVKATWISYKLHDVSQGQDATPVWIPQLVMSAGTVLLAVCFADHLVRLLFTGSHGIRSETVEQSHGE